MIPNHVLILGAPGTGKLRVANHITSINEPHDDEEEEEELAGDETHCGIIKRTSIRTKYYSMDLNILIDEFPEARRSSKYTSEETLEGFKKWFEEFRSADCEELREVLDGIVICLDSSSDSESFIESLMSELSGIRDIIRNGEDSFACVVDISPKTNIDDAVEDIIIGNGFEYIRFNDSGQNEYKESIGKDRLVELIESHEWLNIEGMNNKTSANDNYEQNKKNKVNEMMKGLLEHEEDSEDTDDKPSKSMDLDVIFQKLQLAKENIGDLSVEQRDAYASKFIDEIIDYI